MKPTGQSLKMNGTIIEETPKSIMSNALALMSDDFKYRSKENLIETLVGANDLVIDWLRNRKRKTTKYEKAQADLHQRGRYMSREQVLRMAYNEVLRLDDLGPLRGFGLSNNFKDTLYVNPETKRITHNNI